MGQGGSCGQENVGAQRNGEGEGVEELDDYVSVDVYTYRSRYIYIYICIDMWTRLIPLLVLS